MTPKLYSALKWGALFGGTLGVLETAISLMVLNSRSLADYQVSDCLVRGLEVLVPLAAGVLAARATGERRSGLIAGITSGVIVAVINMITEFVVPVELFIKAFDLGDEVPPPTFVAALYERVLTLGLGAWFGWIGGRIGVALARRSQDS
jgi:hypothetical protein